MKESISEDLITQEVAQMIGIKALVLVITEYIKFMKKNPNSNDSFYCCKFRFMYNLSCLHSILQKTMDKIYPLLNINMINAFPPRWFQFNGISHNQLSNAIIKKCNTFLTQHVRQGSKKFSHFLVNQKNNFF